MSYIDHAPLAPSSAAIWVKCRASVVMQSMVPEADSEHATEGELAHLVCANTLLGKPIPPDATDEMLDGAEMYFDDVMTVKKSLSEHVSLQVEQRVSIKDVHPECWGTPDCSVISIAENKLYLWDYKFGHRYVSPFENWQLLCYAIGKMVNYGESVRDQLKIHMRIVQPRSYHPDGPIREWVIGANELVGYQAKLQAAAADAMSGTAVARSGSHCIDCRARHVCAVAQSAAYSAVEVVSEPVAFGMEPVAIGHELAVLQGAADMLKARISGLENELTGHLKAGVSVPGWMLKQGVGREKWDRPIDEVVALGAMMGIDISKPGAVTPKQAVKAGIPEAVVKTYSIEPQGEIKLVRDTGEQARKAFGS